MQWYRSGHNEHDWKSCCRQKRHEGSKPSHGAILDKTRVELKVYTGIVIFDTKVDQLTLLTVQNDSTKENNIFYIPMFCLSGEAAA